MAKDIIEIEFKPKGDGTLVKAIEKLDEATKSLVKSQSKLVAEGKKVKQTNEKLNKTKKKLTQRTRILGGTFAVLRSKLLLFNFAMGLGIRQLGRFGSASAKVDSMSRAFKTLSGGTDSASMALGKLKKATNSTMSEFDLFQQANNAMILGVTKNSDEMAEMFDIAQRLGRALGRDTASSVESLITGIGRQSRLMLDNIGIIVKADEAYESYAKEIGTTADKLTDAQKKQAFLEATMESARAKVTTLGDEVLTVQDSYDQLSTASSNLASATGSFLQPAIGFLAISFTSIAKSATNYLNTLTNSRKTISEVTNLEEKEEAILAKIAVNKNTIRGLDGFFASSISKRNTLQAENLELETNLLEVRGEIVEQRLKGFKVEKEKLKLDKEAKDELAEKNKKEKEAIELAKQKIEQAKAEAETHKLNFEAIREIENAKRTLYEDNLNFQLMSIDLQADKFREMKLNEADIVKFVEESKRDAVISNLEETSALYRGASATYDQFIQSLVDLEMTGKDRREKIWSATRSSFIVFLGELVKDKIKQLIAEKLIATSAQASSIASAKATGLAIAQAYAVPASLASTASFGGASVAGQAGITASILATKALATFEDGGLVGGRRHSQGGTIIEAERGEFVMSRSAVQSIGVETLNQMNQSGGGGITLNISAPLVDETIVDTIIPAIQKAQRMNLA
jgi:hypothetical protein